MLAFDSGVYSQDGEVEVLLLKVRTLESSRLGRPFSLMLESCCSGDDPC